MSTVQAFALSDLGLVRDSNEDRYLADTAMGIYAVADGVGGAPHGESAAEAALEGVAREARRRLATLSRPLAPDALRELARHCVEAACASVHRIAQHGGVAAGAATTLTLVLHDGAFAAMAHVGDSRLYLHRRGRLEQLSVDHTVANELRRAGVLSQESARLHPLRNVLSRSLSNRSGVEIDTLILPLAPGDTLLLATDGLNEAVDDVGLDPEDNLRGSAVRLIDRAKALGGKDNATAVFLRVQDIDLDPRVRATALLAKIAPFAHLNLAARSRVVGAGFIDELQAGETLVHASDALSGFCLVVKGALTWTGEVSTELEAGGWFGEMALLAPVKCPAEVAAATRSTVFQLPADRWTKLARRRPQVGLCVLRELASSAASRLPAAVVPHAQPSGRR